MAITYAIAPICLLALRDQAPNQLRPFKLPFVKLWSWTAFYICTLLMYWSGWNIISKLGISLIIGLIILFGYHFGTKTRPRTNIRLETINMDVALFYRHQHYFVSW